MPQLLSAALLVLALPLLLATPTELRTTQKPPTEPLTELPSTSGLKFIRHDKSACEVRSGTENDNPLMDMSIDECENECSSDESCKSYLYVNNRNHHKERKCFFYNYRTEKTKGLRRETCGILELGSPTDSPTRSPVTPVTIQQCKLKIVHAHNFTEVNNAPYYGGHVDWLEIQKGKDIETKCTSDYYEENPFWCKYKNSRSTGMGAQVENLEDYYYTETFNITNAAHDLTVINSYHWFFEEDYYAGQASWNDHMMAPIVKVYKLSNNSWDVIGKETGYSHPVSREIPSHTKDNNGNFKPNKDYEGNMRIVIKCTNECVCKVTKFETYSGEHGLF